MAILDDITKLNNQCISSMVQMFDGIPVNIDQELVGLRYYISVSPELFKHIAEHRLHQRTREKDNNLL